ncbi:MAG: hypothetical protein HFJ17_00685 [Clostridia bacterium]|nr:hypothetical protein [Clostridia bacterium]
MVLRKAKLEDFEIFKKLYEDKEGLYQFLYLSKCENPPLDPKWEYDDSILETFNNYTIDQFKTDIEDNTLFLYIIEDNSKILGYISLFYCNNFTYKIAEWAMFHPRNNSKRAEVLDNLRKLKLPNLRRLSICTINNSVGKFLISYGFSPSSYSFYNLKI